LKFETAIVSAHDQSALVSVHDQTALVSVHDETALVSVHDDGTVSQGTMVAESSMDSLSVSS
jgi:hypothetical protein